MLGRELIAFILQNGYSDKEIFDGKRLVGFLSEEEAAEKFGVSVTTIKVWVNQGKMKGIRINEIIFVPYNSIDPRESEVSASAYLSDVLKEKQNE